MQRRNFIPLVIILTISLLLSLSAFAVSAAPTAAKLVGLNGGPCTYETIVDAIANVRPGETNTLYILSGTYNEYLGDITEDITFVPANVGCRTESTGANSDTVVIDASNQTSDGAGGLAHVLGTGDIFRPDPTYVTFRHMTLRDGTASNGGVLAATANGHITLEDVNVIGGSATNGGGIYVSSSSVTLTDDSEVVNNSATNGGGVYGTGATVNLYDVSIGTSATTGNTASSAGGGVYVNGSTLNLTIQGYVRYNEATAGDGGGIYAQNSAVNINIGTIENNEAAEDGGGLYLHGGALIMNGGAIRSNRVSEVTSDSEGGGVYATAATNISISSAIIEQNSANNGGGLALFNAAQLTLQNAASVRSNGAFHHGGGIYAQDTSTAISITQSATIEQNTSGVNGAGIYVINIKSLNLSDGSLVSGNSNGLRGGGIYAKASDPSKLTIDGAEIVGNQAGTGGGIYAEGSSANQQAFSVEIKANAIISGNVAEEKGGGFYLGKVQAQFDDSLISHNQAVITDDLNSGQGGGLYISGGDISLHATTLTENDAGGAGGAIFGNSSLEITSSQLTHNQAGSRGGGASLFGDAIIRGSTVAHNQTDGNGGGINQTFGSLTLDATIVEENDAGINGGGIYATANHKLLVHNSDVRLNSAEDSGGGVFISCQSQRAGPWLFSNTRINNNSAYDGGGVATRDASFSDLAPCPITMQNMTIRANGANLIDGRGGGLFVVSAALTFRGYPGAVENGGCTAAALPFDTYCSEFRDNLAAQGGAVYVEHGHAAAAPTVFSAESTAFINNYANTQGSAVLFGTRFPSLADNRDVAATFASVYLRANDGSPVIETTAATTVTLRNVTNVDQSESPLWITNGNSDLTLQGTVLSGNSIGPFVQSSVSTALSFNYIQPVATDSKSLFSQVDNTLDPLFIQDGGFHRISFNSPLANAGGSSGHPIDTMLLARPGGDFFDIGAFEYGADPAVPTAVMVSEQGALDAQSWERMLILTLALGMVSWFFGRNKVTSRRSS